MMIRSRHPQIAERKEITSPSGPNLNYVHSMKFCS
jgi:hypothetical protein